MREISRKAFRDLMDEDCENGYLYEVNRGTVKCLADIEITPSDYRIEMMNFYLEEIDNLTPYDNLKEATIDVRGYYCGGITFDEGWTDKNAIISEFLNYRSEPRFLQMKPDATVKELAELDDGYYYVYFKDYTESSTRFSDIAKFTNCGNYHINVPLNSLKRTLDAYKRDYGLELNPDFQRGNVWTREQQIAWLEFYFRGGATSRVIYFNSPDFSNDKTPDSDLDSTILCVDGLQRLTAMLGFLDNKIPIFGHYLRDFTDQHKLNVNYNLEFVINNLQTRREVLTWYIEMNTGGTVHSQSEIDKVSNLIKNCYKI